MERWFPSSSSSDPRDVYRVLQLLYFILLVAIALYWLIAEGVFGIEPPRIGEIESLGTAKFILALIALADVILVLYYRYSRIPSLLRQPATDYAQVVRRLRASYMICLVVAQSVALYGFVLRILGGSRDDAIPFFLGAVVLFLLCYPRVPPAPGSPTG